MDLIIQITGAAIVLVAAIDLFLTILYARSGTGLLSPLLNRATWRLFRGAARLSRRRKDNILSYCGPSLIVVLLVFWVGFFIVGFALIIWPRLGVDVTASSGPTPTGFLNAVYYSGYSFSTLGTGNLVPRTELFRMIMVLQSVLGFSFFTLVITYFLSVFSSLHRRNILALTLHYKTLGTADPSEYICRLGSEPDSAQIRSQFTTLSAGLTDLLESHHFYPILHFFRFRETYYGLPRIILIAMDSISLVRSALDGDEYAWLIDSSATGELWHSGTTLLPYLSESFLPRRYVPRFYDESENEAPRWRTHYFSTLEKLRKRGIATPKDPEKGFETYLALRRQWYPYVLAFCEYMQFDPKRVVTFPGIEDSPDPGD